LGRPLVVNANGRFRRIVLKKSEMNGIWQFWRNNESNETDELIQSMRAQAQLRKNIARQFRLRSFSTQSGKSRRSVIVIGMAAARPKAANG
jgi:hypothetical protein